MLTTQGEIVMSDVSNDSPPNRQSEPEVPTRDAQGDRLTQWALVAALILVIILIVTTVVMSVYASSEASRDAPYTKNPRRLQDVIAAIQLLGTYPWHNSDIGVWVDRLEPPSKKTPHERESTIRHWSAVFRQHPEFFRVDENSGRIALRWRLAYDPSYDPRQRKELSEAEISLNPHMDLSRRPLRSDQITTLLTTVIQLHSAEISRQQEKRWLLSSLLTVLGAILGGLLGALVGVAKKGAPAE